MRIEKNYNLLQHNTFHIDARCAQFIEYDSEEELREALPLVTQPCFHLGGGSNVLLVGDFPGTVLHSGIRGIEVNGNIVRAGAAEVWDDFVLTMLQQGLSGLENLSLIPGEVGASAVQNIGAYGLEAKDFIVSVEAINLQTGAARTFAKEECEYGYRSSIFKKAEAGKWAITHVTFKLEETFAPRLDYGNLRSSLGDLPHPTPLDVRQAVIDLRRSKLPDVDELGSAGSFFVNPVISEEAFVQLQAAYPNVPHYPAPNGVKVPAGWLIEQCGWKGKDLGHAGVYEKQALVIVNHGGATGEEIVRLSDAIRADVAKKFGIEIRPEVVFLNQQTAGQA